MSPRSPAPLRLAPLWLAGLNLSISLLAAAPATTPAPTFAFNGHDLAGFSIQNGGHFSVHDGSIVIDRGTGWLRSDATFGDFELVVEVRFDEPQANSGIFIRTGPTSHDDDKGYPDHGYQVQCMDIASGDHPLGTLLNYGGSDFVQLFDERKIAAAMHPTGEWNRLEITCRGETVAVRLNGELIDLVQGIARPTGHVGLQGELGLLRVRRFEVRALPSP